MRKLVVIGLVLCVGIFVGIGSRGIQPNARAAGGGGLASRNGDTNGDGEIDLTDAVYLLAWLFQGGPEPVANADSPEVLGRIAALEEKAVKIEALERGLSRFDGVLAGLSGLQGRVEQIERPCREKPDRFIDNQDGTVSDTCTGLMWTRQPSDPDGNGQWNQFDSFSWQEAKDYCEGLAWIFRLRAKNPGGRVSEA